jgi:hypothetical protein
MKTAQAGTSLAEPGNLSGIRPYSMLRRYAPAAASLVGPAQVFSFDYPAPTGLSFRATDGWRYSVTTGVSYHYDSPSGAQVNAWIPTTETSIFAVRERSRFLRQPAAAEPGSSAGPTQPGPRALT